MPNTPQTKQAPPDPDIAARHEDSVRRYPELNLSANEYVIQSVRRHPIGLISIWAVAGLLIVLLLAALPVYASLRAGIASAFSVSADSLPTPVLLATPVLILIAFFALGGVIATIVYQSNRFFLTSESVIQFVRPSLFNTQTQILNLANVEDSSYLQRGILQQVLNYGTLRLSTKGEETVYMFAYVANPGQVINAVNDAVEVALKRLEAGPA
jgi:hypothetical protein